MKIPFSLWLGETKTQIIQQNLTPMAYISAFISCPPILHFVLSFFLPLDFVNSIFLF